MDLLAYWRYDNYIRDLDEGAGFHFNSNQSRLHTAIHIGERLWLFTRVVNKRVSSAGTIECDRKNDQRY